MLFDTLVEHMRAVEPGIRVAVMFGCPAAFVGRRLAFCVYGQGIGAKLPRAEVSRLIGSGEAVPFRPFGRPVMPEWVELCLPLDEAVRAIPVLRLAIGCARQRA